jgi:hypothetical protein
MLKMIRGLVLIAILLTSPCCIGFYGTRSSYGGGNGAEVNGAVVSLRVKPEGTSGGSYAISAMVVGVGIANLDGPFRWRIEAEGKEGIHEAIYVQRIRTVTKLTKRDEWFPEKWLGERVNFTRKQDYEAGVVKAVFDIPGRLEVLPKEDGALDVLVDLIVSTKVGQVRKVVKFRLDPARRKDNEMIFLPAEIVSSIGKPVSEWEEKGWD